MELGVYVPVRVWVGRSSGSYDAHWFPPSYPPQPARLAGGCTAPGLLAGDRTGPEILAGLLPSRRYTETRMLSLGQDIRRWHQPRREFRTRITGGAWRGVRDRKSAVAEAIVRLESLALGRVRQGEQRRLAAASRRAGSLARPGTRRIRECGPARATATAVSRIEAISKQFATNSRNSLLFGRSAVRLYRGGREKIELVIV